MVTKLEGLSITAFLLAILAFTQVGDLSLEPTHVCNTDKELKGFCYELSDSKVTCYTQEGRTGGKQCRGGQWELIPQAEIKKASGTLSTNKIHCISKGCI